MPPVKLAKKADLDALQDEVDGLGGGTPDDGSVTIPKFASGVLDTDDTLAADSDSKIPTQQAVKGYVDTASGLLIPKSLVDAKGDLLVGTADNTVARKAVGADGKSLVADSAQGDGLNWALRRSVVQGDLPVGAITQTHSRTAPGSSSNVSISGNHLWVTGGDAVIPAGATASSITIWSSTQAAVTPTAQVFYLIDKSLNVLARTSDDTTTAWGANTGKTLSLTSTYTPTADTPVYIGILVVAATQPTLIGTAGYNSNIVGISPPSYGRSTTNTTPASIGSTVATVTVNGTPFYAYVS